MRSTPAAILRLGMVIALSLLRCPAVEARTESGATDPLEGHGQTQPSPPPPPLPPAATPTEDSAVMMVEFEDSAAAAVKERRDRAWHRDGGKEGGGDSEAGVERGLQGATRLAPAGRMAAAVVPKPLASFADAQEATILFLQVFKVRRSVYTSSIV